MNHHKPDNDDAPCWATVLLVIILLILITLASQL